VLFPYRLRVLASARELGSVAAACRLHGFHRSTFYRWNAMSDRFGLEILRPRERRRPQMPNAIPVFVEHRIIAFALGAPGSGPARIASELAREKHGGPRVSKNGVNVDHPVELVQMDCFCIGRLAGTKGVVWQYTAIDAASSFCWAELHVTLRNPDVCFASRLAHRVARDLRDAGWELERVSTDNGSEFRNHVFDAELERLGARRTLISPGRPRTASSSVCSAQSSRSAGSPPSRATWCPSTWGCAGARALPRHLQP
jgi:transposase InsO family protein